MSDGHADFKLLELVRLRVAQIHQNPISIQMHLDELRATGETEERLNQLESWITSSLFTENEGAALALCDKISCDSASPLPNVLIREMRQYFTRGAIVKLTLAIINAGDLHRIEGGLLLVILLVVALVRGWQPSERLLIHGPRR